MTKECSVKWKASCGKIGVDFVPPIHYIIVVQLHESKTKLIETQIFYDFNSHVKANQRSSTDWRKQDKHLIPGAVHTAICVRETAPDTLPTIYPVIEVQDDKVIVANDFYLLYDETQVSAQKGSKNKLVHKKSVSKEDSSLPFFPPLPCTFLHGEPQKSLSNPKKRAKKRYLKKWRKLMLPQALNRSLIPELIRGTVEQLYDIQWRRRLREGQHRGEFVRLKMEYLRNLCGKYTDKALRWLLAKGLWVCDNMHRDGRCNGYAVAEMDYEAFDIEDDAVIRRVSKRRKTFLMSPAVKRLEKDLSRITIVPPTEEEYIAIAMKNRKSNMTIEQLVQIYKDEVKLLQEMPIIFNVDEFGQRVHTPVTSLKTELRPFLRVDGEPLVEVDINCSQFVFLAIILEEQGKADPNFTKICEEGRLYDKIADILDISRKTSKGDMFHAVFAPNRYSNEPWRLFRELYPTVVKFCKHIKKNGYKKLSSLLQRRESSFIIETCCKRLYEMDDSIPLLTIHDSILAPQRYADKLLQVMEQEFRALNFNPKLEVEVL